MIACVYNQINYKSLEQIEIDCKQSKGKVNHYFGNYFYAIVSSIRYKVIHLRNGNSIPLLTLKVFDESNSLQPQAYIHTIWGQQSSNYLRFHIRKGSMIIVMNYEAFIDNEDRLKLNAGEVCILSYQGNDGDRFEGMNHSLTLCKESIECKHIYSHLIDLYHCNFTQSLLNYKLKHYIINGFHELLYSNQLCTFTTILIIDIQCYHTNESDVIIIQDKLGIKTKLRLNSKMKDFINTLSNNQSDVDVHIQVIAYELRIERVYNNEIKMLYASHESSMTLLTSLDSNQMTPTTQMQTIKPLLWHEFIDLLHQSSIDDEDTSSDIWYEIEITITKIQFFRDNFNVKDINMLNLIEVLEKDNEYSILYRNTCIHISSMTLLDDIPKSLSSYGSESLIVLIDNFMWQKIFLGIPAALYVYALRAKSKDIYNGLSIIQTCNDLLSAFLESITIHGKMKLSIEIESLSNISIDSCLPTENYVLLLRDMKP